MTIETHGLDTLERVFFYEHDFYVLSNFSAFALCWKDRVFLTSEAAYQWEKFGPEPWGVPWEKAAWDDRVALREGIQANIHAAMSAHEAFKIAEQCRVHRRCDWDAVKVGIMREILCRKASQHEYVRRKLLATGNRELIEDSWRDDFWGWGPNRDGQNQLGRLWMDIREELREQERVVVPSRGTLP